MLNKLSKPVRITAWSRYEHPTLDCIAEIMRGEGLQPYGCRPGPNFRQGVQSHRYNKVFYCVTGAMNIRLPDTQESARLRPGDRMSMPTGTRYQIMTGARGAEWLEAPQRHRVKRRS